MRLGWLGLIVAAVAGCALVAPSVAPQPAVFASASPAPPTASSAALVPDSVGGLSFTRPASWSRVVPPTIVIPGPFLWLASEPLSNGCPMTPLFPTQCLPGGTLPDGGVLVILRSGAVLLPSVQTLTPLASFVDDTCAAVGGQAVRTHLAGISIEACLRGEAARAAVDAFVRSLVKGT
jgi:hypothetical protein